MKDKLEKLKSEKFLKISDIVIIVSVVLAILLLLFFTSVSTPDNAMYEIYVENQLYQTGYLSEDAEIHIETENGSLTFVVENGSIHACDATCADGLCEKQGMISTSGAKIICLPTKVFVTITGDIQSGVDAVS